MPFTDSELDQIDRRMAHAVTQGLRDVLEDREAIRKFWEGALDAASAHAAQQTGNAVLGAVKFAVTRGALFLLVGMLIYSLGGWGALATTWRAFFGSQGGPS